MPQNPHATANIAGHPLHAMLVPIPLTCFIGTFITDLAYWHSANMQYANMSVWLLTAGLIVSVFAAAAGLTDFFGDRRIRNITAAWIHGLGNALALLLSLVNVFVHSRDAYTSVVPAGLILSGLVVLILIVTAWLGGALVYRHGVGVEDRQ